MKACPFCAEEIQDAAIVCRFCNRGVANGDGGVVTGPLASVIITPAWSPGVAAVLSLVIPGAGQMYKGKVGAGIMWLVAVVLGYMAFIAPGLILHLVCILNAASGGAVSGNVQKSTGATHTQLYILLGILLFVIFLASQSPMFGN